MKAVTQDRLDQIVSLYQQGRTFVEIEKTLHVGQVPIQRALKQAGLESRPRVRQPVSHERKEAIASSYAAGHSIADCMKQYRASSVSVAQSIQESGVERRRHWGQDRIQSLVEMYHTGLSLSECARRLQTAKHVVRKYLKLAKVHIRPQVEATGRGPMNGNWKGGRSVQKDGYVYVLCPPGHPHLSRNRYILEHHLAMEQHLGRFLLPGEVVHHKDKNKHNNLIGNLQLFASNGEHLAAELKGQTPRWSEEGRKRIVAAHRRWCEEQRKTTRSRTCAPQ